MTAVIPTIKVYNTNNPVVARQGTAGNVAVVGSFNTEETNPVLFASIDEAYESFGNDSTFNGCSVISDLFTGASSLLAVNTTTWTGSGENKTADKTMTVAKLTAALTKIKGEDWDILFIAETLSDTFLPVITEFLDECYEMKYPAGYIGALNGATTAANVTSAGLAGNHCYGLITQQLEVNGTELSLLRSAAYYCGVIAGMQVGDTMTMKPVPGVTGVNPELSFETGGTGKTLLEAGITTIKCQDRGNGRYIVVNSEQPNGYDLYINRVRDYVVKELSLNEFLGERNNETTLSEIKHEVDRVKNECVKTLNLLKDIVYTVEKTSANCVNIHITSLLFDGIITEIDVYVTVEVA